MAETELLKERVMFYVDGFNLYFSLKENRYERYMWLDLNLLATSLLTANQKLVGVKYFTSLITTNIQKRLRQKTYIDALLTLPNLQIIFGRFNMDINRCGVCGQDTQTPKEKRTDVAIASHMLHDAHMNLFDTAVLISGDTDLIPPVTIIREHFKNKRVVVAFPPDRQNDTVKEAASAWFVIGRAKFAQSQFADNVVSERYEETYVKPATWI